ncbi:efflux RND transporter permease subunit [Gloeobacter violaceus]|uniref:RND multidrug efflux transporter n=1 Tax=Gloeobacter violaceus (strain ATCC 29082 / PCC 7421) TaxID=251221 RepID=Q7NCY7_GLOVI|nr:multidrug efflux RND transporter permease subunit [Gloeobacter violaceus]BAC90780.1 RND multidrug efflux transporter [Gloeobacter violaceus PCC 7421]
MFVNYFVQRPILTIACSVIIVLGGWVSIRTLPVDQYPDIALPQVVVTARYDGASAEVVESTVTTPLEQQINGAESMRYMTSTSSNDGTSTITVTFDLARNIDDAAMDIQNRLTAVQGRLPEEVRRTGVTIRKNASQVTVAFGLYAKNNEYDNTFISNYADLYISDALRRVKGVGDVRIFGERRYSMRLWLDADRLAARRLSAVDVVRALETQNLQVGAGQVGQPPSLDGQPYQISVRAVGRLKSPAQFDNLILKRGADGALVRLKDVGRTELGAEDYTTFLRFTGRNAVGIAVSQLPGANTLDVYREVKAELDRQARAFPPGLEYEIAFDSASMVDESIHEVVKTLIEAVVLVVAVMFIFLQDWRGTLIPAIAIPVSLVGTFIFVKLLGFSINTLTLFGITLAAGLVVDDAIVVVENIVRYSRERGLTVRAAAPEAMREVFGAVIATSLVLVAVFVPVAFFPGTAGRLYQQFALTLTFSIALSTFIALTLTPTLSALLLRAEPPRHWLFDRINDLIDWLRRGYARSLGFALRFRSAMLGVFVCLLGLAWWLFGKVPPGFVPNEDQSYFVVFVQCPEGSSLDYTNKVMLQVEQELRKLPELARMFAIGGYSPSGNAPNKATIFPHLLPLAERRQPSQSVDAIIDKVRGPLSRIPGATVAAFPMPAIQQGVGQFGGFQLQVQDQRNLGLETLAGVTRTLVEQGNAQPGLSGLFSSFSINDPQLVVEVNREKAEALAVAPDEVLKALQIYMGSLYVNDFEMFNRPYRVYVQADRRFRSTPQDLRRFYVRSQTGAMIPLGNLVTVSRTVAPQIINHYNMLRSAEVNGAPAEGFSSGQAIEQMQKLAEQVLPQGIRFQWSGVSLEQIESGNKALFIFVLGVVFVFLVLAAQYESLTDPLVIMLSVPLAIVGALGAQALRGLENDIYCQIGLVMLIGLASKNAILIVEFANQLCKEGLTRIQAVSKAAQIRLRPILMTSFAFILGVVPLVMAEGAGAAGRQSLGTAVFGGMLVSTALSLYIVPVLYIVIGALRERFKGDRTAPDLLTHDSSTQSNALEIPSPSQK